MPIVAGSSSSARSRSNAFATTELDRASEFREDRDALLQRALAPSARYVVLRADGHALSSADRSGLHAFDAQERARLAPEGNSSYLGQANGSDYFLLTVEADRTEQIVGASGATFLDLRSAGGVFKAFDAGLFAYARGLAHWQSRTRFCAACAAPLRLESGGHRAKCTNPQCGIEHFPRTDPAIIVIVGDGDRCLLGRGPQWPERRYSTLAGFVEPGETLEDAVRREVFEEAGVRVGECDYHSSQPWPFPASIMLGFTAEAEDATITLGSELAEARWFSADELIAGLKARTLGLSSPLSVSFRLIEHWLRETAGVELSELAHDDPLFATKR